MVFTEGLPLDMHTLALCSCVCSGALTSQLHLQASNCSPPSTPCAPQLLGAVRGPAAARGAGVAQGLRQPACQGAGGDERPGEAVSPGVGPWAALGSASPCKPIQHALMSVQQTWQVGCGAPVPQARPLRQHPGTLLSVWSLCPSRAGSPHVQPTLTLHSLPPPRLPASPPLPPQLQPV